MNPKEVFIRPERMKSLVADYKIYKSAYDWKLTEKDLEKARIELGETDQVKERCLRELRELISNEPNCSYRTDYNFLIRFLRLRKYDVARTFQSIKEFHHSKMDSEFCYIPSNFKEVLDSDIGVFLPYTDIEGRVLFWIDAERWNPKEVPFLSLARSMCAIVDIITCNPNCQVNGVVGVWNASGVNLSHFTQLVTKNRVLKVLSLLQKQYPWRIKKIVLINSGKLVRLLWRMIRPLISKKVADRIIILDSDLTGLKEHVDVTIFPKKVGGTLEEFNVTDFVLENLDYLRHGSNFT